MIPMLDAAVTPVATFVIPPLESFSSFGVWIFLGGCVWSVTVALMTRTGRRRRVGARRGIEMVGRSVKLSDQREAA